MAASPIFAEAGVMQFMPVMTEVGITWRNPGHLFRIAQTDEQAAQALAAHVGREFRGKKVAVIYTDSFYTRPLIEVVRAGLPAHMNVQVRFETLMDATGSAEKLVGRLRRSPPDLIYLAVDPEPVARLVTLLRESGIGATIMGGQRLLTYRFLGTAAAEGVQALAPIGPLDSPQYVDAIGLLERSGVVPDLIALNSYAAVQVWAEAVRRAESGEHRSVVEILQSARFDTAVGPMAFDLQGDRRDIQNTIVVLNKGRMNSLAENR
jgi:branched-chain amino acid transport system substrate-binding protein